MDSITSSIASTNYIVEAEEERAGINSRTSTMTSLAPAAFVAQWVGRVKQMVHEQEVEFARDSTKDDATHTE